MIKLANHAPVLDVAIEITTVLILLGALCSFLRLVKGPTLPDRVVSVDLITVLAVSIVGLMSVASGTASLSDVAFALALVAFLATVAFAWYADRRTGRTPVGEADEDATRNG